MTSGGRSAVRARVERYDLGVDRLPESAASVPAGTNLLVMGPPLVGKPDLVSDIVTAGAAADQSSVLVSPDSSVSSLRERVGSAPYVVDCSGLGGDAFDPDARVASVSSPQDLTGVGMSVVKCTRAIGSEAARGLRLGVLSLSTLLQYTDPDRVFNFLHVLTGRIAAAGYLGVFAIDATSHDETTLNTIKSQFDGAVRLRDTDDGVAAEALGL